MRCKGTDKMRTAWRSRTASGARQRRAHGDTTHLFYWRLVNLQAVESAHRRDVGIRAVLPSLGAPSLLHQLNTSGHHPAAPDVDENTRAPQQVEPTAIAYALSRAAPHPTVLTRSLTDDLSPARRAERPLGPRRAHCDHVGTSAQAAVQHSKRYQMFDSRIHPTVRRAHGRLEPARTQSTARQCVAPIRGARLRLRGQKCRIERLLHQKRNVGGTDQGNGLI